MSEPSSRVQQLWLKLKHESPYPMLPQKQSKRKKGKTPHKTPSETAIFKCYEMAVFQGKLWKMRHNLANHKWQGHTVFVHSLFNAINRTWGETAVVSRLLLLSLIIWLGFDRMDSVCRANSYGQEFTVIHCGNVVTHVRGGW